MRFPGSLRSAAARRLAGLATAGLLSLSLLSGGPAMAAQSGYDLNSPPVLGQVLANDWHISPAGTQVTVGNLPTNAALSPDGRYLAVTNNGCSDNTQEISVIDLTTATKVASARVTASFLGVAFSLDGSTLYVSGGNDNKIYTFSFAKGQLTPAASIPVEGYPAGLAVLPDGNLAVAENQNDKVALMDTKADKVTAEIAVGRFPYWVTASNDGKDLYVSNWGSDSVSVIDLAKQTATAEIPVGQLPEAMTLSDQGLLYVADTNSDSVSVIDTSQNQVVQTIDVHFAGLPSGSAPTSVALSSGDNRLYVSLAGINADAVVNLGTGQIDGYIPTAWYPTGVYFDAPSNLVLTLNGKGLGTGPDPDGPKPGTTGTNQSQNIYSMISGTVSILPVPDKNTLATLTQQVQANALVNATSGIGGGSGNPIPLHPGQESPIKYVFYIVRENRTYDQILGDLSQADGDPNLVLFGQALTPNAHRLATQFAILDNYYADAEVSAQGHNWTDGAYSTDYVEKNAPLYYSSPSRYAHYDAGVVPISSPPNGYLWKELNERNISYKIYGESIYLTSALYDLLVQNLGASDPVTTNLYQFSRTTDPFTEPYGFYAALAPYYRDSVSQLGDLLATDSSLRNQLSSILTGSTALADRMAGDQQLTQAVADYIGHYEINYMTANFQYPDANPSFFPTLLPFPPAPTRAAAFEQDFAAQLEAGDVPAFSYIWLPNDHTAGMAAGYPTPAALVADNDQALGQIVDTITHSPIWKESAIFVTEDDAQDGSDHVDGHRTVGLVISPYAERGIVCHTHYDQMSMMRTMELILGLDPMSMYDAAALPMYDLFTSTPDLTPYAAVRPSASAVANATDASLTSYLTKLSAGLDLSRPDVAGQDGILNTIIWESVKGTPYVPVGNNRDS